LIENFSAGKTAENFKEDILFRSAVERQFTILGEAVAKLLKLDPDLEKPIDSARQIVGFRNQLIHNYGGIDPDLVWTILMDELPKLKKCSQDNMEKLKGQV
jgi:uncharacterized protein with HEPN domain